MHAVIVDVIIQDREAAGRELEEEVIPSVSQAPGFVAGYWIAVGPDRGHSVVVLESEEAANAVAERARAGAPSAVTMTGVGVHPVIASA